MSKPHPAWSGAVGRCIECGNGKLFSGYLKVAPRCEACGFDLEKAGAGDAPVTGILVLVGAIGMAGIIYSETHWHMADWLVLLIWCAVVIVLSLAILPPLKGLLIGMQHHYHAAEHVAPSTPAEEKIK